MREWINQWQPKPWLTRKLLLLAVLVGVGVGAFFAGRRQHAVATSPQSATGPAASPEEMQRRPVAYLFDDIPVTRAELGEYLIARFGGERLEFLVTRKIVEMECAKHNIIATDAEVDLRFQQHLKGFGQHITEYEFVNNILRKFGKTLYEYKEDVIRPTIMLEHLVKSKVQPTEKDLQDCFEARHGPKVECRIIVLDGKASVKMMQELYENASKGPVEFLVEARRQFIPDLAQKEGKVPAIHRHFGDKQLEDIAFSLKPGQISGLTKMPDGTYVLLMCERHVPADTKVKFEDERQKLAQDVAAMQLAQKVPEEFERLRKLAQPRLLLAKQDPRGQLPQLPMYSPTSQPASASDLPPLNPGPVAPVDGYAPLSVPNTPLPAPTIAPPPLPAFTPPEEKK